ncbi:hypothetical protein [Actinomadura sp. 9N407]|uniref:hypothetical protein n=1 Tax=Actinomadura sp. 9N407 TaxID=3375154 RepID=UPI00379B2D5A
MTAFNALPEEFDAVIRNSRRVVALAIAGAVAIAPVISGCGAGSNPQSAAPTQLTEGVNASVPKGAATSQVDIRNMFLLGPQADKMFTTGASVPLYATIINQVEGRQDRLVRVAAPDFAQAKITGGAVTLPPAQPTGEGTPVTLTGPAAAPTPAATDKKTKQPGAGATEQPGATDRPSGEATRPGAEATPQPGQQTSPPASDSPTATPPPGSPTTRPTDTTGVTPEGKAPTVVLSGLNRQLLGGETLRIQLEFEHAGSIEIAVPVVPHQREYAEYAAVSPGVPAPGATATPTTPAPAGSPGHGSTPEGTQSPTPGGAETPATGGH